MGVGASIAREILIKTFVREQGSLLQNLADFSDIVVLKSVLMWVYIRADLPCYADFSKIVHMFCTTAQTKHGNEKRQY